MATPIWNNNAGQPLAANANFCAITSAPIPIANQGQGQNGAAMIDLVSYYILGGSSGVGTVLTFQELGGDGTWRSLVAPVPVTIANSTAVNGIVNGPFHGLRINVSGLVGNGAAYAELKGSVRSM